MLHRPTENHQLQMATPSIYKSKALTTPFLPSNTAPKPGDGFTEIELARALDPLQRDWDPKRKYESFSIAHLVPGPKAVTFKGRIVNLSTRYGSSATQPKAKGWHYLIVKDDTAAITVSMLQTRWCFRSAKAIVQQVKLYFANAPFPLRLGQLLTFWTAFISEIPKDEIHPKSPVRITANMFPGRVASDHFLAYHSSSTTGIYRAPLGYEAGQQLAGLTTLDGYLRSGHDDVTDAKILVVVKSIGATKKIQRKDEEYDLAQVTLMDNTAEVRMTLWNDTIQSTREWRPAETVLLISSPGYRPPHDNIGYGKGNIEIRRHTMIDIDPDLADTVGLRRWAEIQSRREALTWEFVDEDWDTQISGNKVVKTLFTLADLDNWARSKGDQTLTCYVNVTIMSLRLEALHSREKLMCGRCCGVPLYSNSSFSSCLTCGKPTLLMPNARLIGALLDETGCIDGGSLLWSPHAWEKIFGREVDDIASYSFDEICELEQRLSFLRLHLCVGWKGSSLFDGSIGRLYVLGVKV
ncbi:hypothetical protein K3495_g3024 [Podosphaera aphanis]|nr:hypothetical protein K3495_g3024 [Podosphaera aphanis]